ncbi:3172_t:CDS:1, partial [Racocetra fulgida]
MNSEPDSDYNYEDFEYNDYNYEDYILYSELLSSTNTSSPSPALEINTSSPSSISETSTILTSETTNIISSKKPSPLWQYFYFKSDKPNNLICDKCKFEFLDKSGNSTLKKHLSSQYNIIVPRVKTHQSKLIFTCKDPWPEKQKKERNIALI